MSDLIVPPPPGLADCVQHALLKTLPGGPYLLPAGLQPLFLLILRGRITLHHAGRDTVLAPFLLCGGTRGIRRSILSFVFHSLLLRQELNWLAAGKHSSRLS